MDMDAQDLHDVERAEISPISWTGRLMFSVNQIFLCLGFGAGVHFPGAWLGGWGVAEEEVSLPEVGLDKLCPKAFSVENLDLFPFLFVCWGMKRELITCAWLLIFPGMSYGLSVFGCPLGNKKGGQGWVSV